jgi:hypothetical protein
MGDDEYIHVEAREEPGFLAVSEVKAAPLAGRLDRSL